MTTDLATTAPEANHLPGLDLLRALAVIWVMLFHSYLVGGLGDDWTWLSRYGWAGVDMFFVLSGFLIGRPVLQTLRDGAPLRMRAFYARRAWRILPAYAVVLAIYLAAPALREAPGLAPGWQFATFSVNLLIDYTQTPAFSHAWSLCVEEHFYLLFPWLAIGAWRCQPMARQCVGAYAGLVLAGIALRTGVWLHDAALDPPRNWFIEDLYYPTWMRLDGLLVGVALAALQVHRPQLWARCLLRPRACLVTGLALASAGLWLFADRTGLLANAIGWPLLSLGWGGLVMACASPQGWLGRWHCPGAAWIAALSYSLYLSHKLAFHGVERWVAPRMAEGGWLLFGCYALATLALGAALHYAVERPCLQWRDRGRKTL